MFLASTTGDVSTEMMEGCMIPLMWAPYFIGGGTPMETLDKIDLLVASVPAEETGRCTNSSNSGGAIHVCHPAHLERK